MESELFLGNGNWTQTYFFSNFSGTSGISRQNPGISRPKSLISLVSRDVSNFLAPTRSRGRPPPHPKISGPKSLGLGSFFLPDFSPLLSRARKKGFSFFFLWGDPVQNRPQNQAPAGCLFSTRKSRSGVPERGDFGARGRMGRTGQKKEKRMRKKRWVFTYSGEVRLISSSADCKERDTPIGRSHQQRGHACNLSEPKFRIAMR